MGDPPSVLAQFFIRRQGWAGGDFALEPGAEGFCGGDFACGAQARDDGACVVAVRVGEVSEVQGWFDARVGAGEVELALGARARDVGRHAEGVDGFVVSETGGVEAEGDLVAVHHHVGWFVGGAGRAAEEDPRVAVHRCLVRWDRAVEFPDDDRFRVVQEVVADSRDRVDDGDAEGGELLRGTNTRVEEEARGVDCTGTENGFFAGVERELGTGLQG